jgi:hypothetical protein
VLKTKGLKLLNPVWSLYTIPMANIVIRIPRESKRLPDNAAYTNRFEIRSASSDRLYTVAQSKTGQWWACSCPGWIRHKHCKHLQTLSLPGNYTPFKATLPAGK